MHTFLQISHIQLPKGSRQVTHNIEIVVRKNMGISQPLETRQTTGYLLEMRKRLVFADSIWEHGWDWCFSDFFLRSQIIVSLHITYYSLTNDLEINGNLAYKKHKLSFKLCYIVAAFKSWFHLFIKIIDFNWNCEALKDVDGLLSAHRLMMGRR